jgi:hypothetical protein
MTNIKRIRAIYHVPGGSGVMVLNATFNDFSVISWRSVFILHIMQLKQESLVEQELLKYLL